MRIQSWAIHRTINVPLYFESLLVQCIPARVPNTPWLLLLHSSLIARTRGCGTFARKRISQFCSSRTLRLCRTCVTCNCIQEAHVLSHPPSVIRSHYVCPLIYIYNPSYGPLYTPLQRLILILRADLTNIEYYSCNCARKWSQTVTALFFMLTINIKIYWSL